ncbi:PilN domain-containing protein [Luteimonas sp. MC1825]|uniref:PilN domain-containing protein n=1 Tax=Luteimonas sp. MC1825 TaxID=2761107 RepID=UPI00161E2937|nr:PilN domain-containing protein [Luteimonas sp. MC1825]MBB6600054.1 PilN domain-containing protein [Luteimonas sp. MC1825]QOC87756.1 PilN domain-containing protein [Luteimonas sp. MC1825]
MSAVEPTADSTPIRQRLGRMGGSLRPGVAGFWSWWTQALATWLPARLRELFGLAHERLLLAASADGLRLSMDRGDAVRAVAELPPFAVTGSGDDPLAPLLAQRVAELPRWLLLPAGDVLRRRLPLPAAAAERLREVMGFEVERQTPFPLADVEYDARVVARRGDGQLETELVVVPRHLLEARLAALGPLAGTLTGVDVADDLGGGLGVNLLPGARRVRRADPWMAWNLALGAVAVIALAAGLWQVLANRQLAADVFEAEVEQAAIRARGAAAQKKELVDLVEGMAFLSSARAARPTTVEVLDELSRRLPDSTYIEKLSIEDTRILLIGLSSEASSLVQRLEGSPLWRSPALAGALQPDPRSGRDRFTLTAELAVADVPAAAAAGDTEAANARSNP